MMAAASAINQTGLCPTEVSKVSRISEPSPQTDQWQGWSPVEVQTALGLNTPPGLVMSDTNLKHEMVAALTQGVIMDVAYRLEFLDLHCSQTTRSEVVNDFFDDAVRAVVEDLAGRLGDGL